MILGTVYNENDHTYIYIHNLYIYTSSESDRFWENPILISYPGGLYDKRIRVNLSAIDYWKDHDYISDRMG